MKIAIYGGTFDPIHYAHLVIAEHAFQQLQLSRLLFIPSFSPPHKLHKSISTSEHRLVMTRLAAQNNPHFEVSDYEIQKKGTSFTVDTLEHFAAKFNLDREHLFLIMGADNFTDFHKWKAPDRIAQLATLVFAHRPKHNVSGELAAFEHIELDSPLLEISASYIRKLDSEGKSPRYLLPESVLEYIEKNCLYKS